MFEFLKLDSNGLPRSHSKALVNGCLFFAKGRCLSTRITGLNSVVPKLIYRFPERNAKGCNRLQLSCGYRLNSVYSTDANDPGGEPSISQTQALTIAG